MEYLEQVEAFHERLLSFCQTCALPRARAMAAARFLLSLSSDDQDADSYRMEAGSLLTDALRMDPGVTRDSSDPAVLGQALSLLVDAGVLDEEKKNALLAGIRTLPLSGRADDRQSGFLCEAAVPLVCELPPVPHEIRATYLGVLTSVAVSGRCVSPGEPAVVWNNENLGQESNRLRYLGNVAADARMTARHALHELCQSRPAEHGLASLSRRALKAVDLDRLGFEISLPEKEMPVAGRSISLALGCAMCGTMLGLLRGGLGLGPRADLAWTGVLTPSGRVEDVDAESLRAKIQVARAAGLAGIVVSRTQGDAACLAAEETGWDGVIYTVSSLAEVFQHPDLVVPLELPSGIRAHCQRSRLQRHASSILLGIVLAALLLLAPRLLDEAGAHWFPFWRPVPRLAELDAPRDVAYGFHLRVPRMADLHAVPGEERTFAFALLTDEVGQFREPGPYLVLGESINEAAGEDGRVTLLHIPTRRVVATYEPNWSWLPDDPPRETSANLYTVKRGVVANMDDDEEKELVIAITFNPTSRCILQILDRELKIERSLEHMGHLEHLVARDLDQDGRSEILALGFHNATQGMSLLAVKTEDFYVMRDSLDLHPPSRYEVEGRPFDPDAQPCYRHVVLPFRPWMGEIPLDPFHQLGLFSLALGPEKNIAQMIRVVASMNAHHWSLILTLGLPETVHEVTFAQPFTNEVLERQRRGELPADALERFEEDVRASLYWSDTIVMDGAFIDRGAVGGGDADR